MTYSKTKDVPRLVLMVIATHANAITHIATVGHALLAREVNTSERTIIRHLKTLEKSGELTITRGSGKGNLTAYTINLPRTLKGDNMCHPLEDESPKGDNPVQRVTHVVTLTENSKGDKSGQRVTNGASKGDKSNGAYKDIEPLNHENNNVVVLRARVSAESEQREYLTLAKQNGHTNGIGKTGNYGVHLYADYLDYVTATKPGKDTAQAIGLARWMQKQGEDDEAVAAWLKSKQSPVQKPKPAACPTCGGRGFNRRPTPTDPINNQLCETCNGKGHALQAAV